MGFKDSIIQKLRVAANEKQHLHKHALHLNKSLKDVEKMLGDKKSKKRG